MARALPVSAGTDLESTTALGDWYVNRLVVDRRPLLLLVSSRTLLPILIPARNVASLPTRLADLVGARLRRAMIPKPLIEAELKAMSSVAIGKTRDRAVVGIMVDFALAVPYHLPARAWDDTTLPFIEAQLRRTPCFSSRGFRETLWPDRATPDALAARWGAG